MARLRHIEALRGFAALYVLLHHALPLEAMPPLAALPFRFGQEAVMLFFLVSGYVIHHSWTGSYGRYVIARLVRIYPIFIAALALSYVCASLAAGGPLAPDIAQLAGNLAMLQDRAREGSIVSPYMGNAPLWSLSYEVFFYAAYALAMRTGRPHSFALTASILGLVAMLLVPFQGFRFLAYFMIWWIGVGLAEAARGNRGPLIAAVSCTSVGVIAFAAQLEPVANLGAFPVLELRHFGSALLFAGGFVVWSRLGWGGLRWTIGPFAALAPISYALYAVHYPLLTIGLPPVVAVAAALALAILLERASAVLEAHAKLPFDSKRQTTPLQPAG